MSWSIAGDTPSLGDLAEWEEDQSKLKTEPKIRPNSVASHDEARSVPPISPQEFQPSWKEEHQVLPEHHRTEDSGTTTPLPVFFEQSANERRVVNHPRDDPMPGHKVENMNDINPIYTGSNPCMKALEARPPEYVGDGKVMKGM